MSWNIVQASSFYQLPALNAKFMSLYFSSFLQKHVSFNHFKRPRTILVTNENVKLKELLVLEFCRNPNKVISILTETHIYHDQIHHIRNNWLGSNFFSLGIVTQKDACPPSSGTWRLTLIQKGILCPLSLLPLMTELSVFMPLRV